MKKPFPAKWVSLKLISVNALALCFGPSTLHSDFTPLKNEENKKSMNGMEIILDFLSKMIVVD